MSYMASKDEAVINAFGKSSPGIASHRGGAFAGGDDVVRIRKYPNRRLYDTSRSRHLTHDGVIALVAEGRTVQVTDSRSGADITNAVLLQIMIERDPQKIAALPSDLVIRAMRSDAGPLSSAAREALAAWSPGSADSTSAHAIAGRGVMASPPVSLSSDQLTVGSTSGGRERGISAAATAHPDSAPAMSSGPAVVLTDASGRPKARAKRDEGFGTSVAYDLGSA